MLLGVREIKKQVGALRKRVKAIETSIRSPASPTAKKNSSDRRDIPKEHAKEEIRGAFASGETIFISELADRLNLPDDLVVEICDELLKEGEIRVNADVFPSR